MLGRAASFSGARLLRVLSFIAAKNLSEKWSRVRRITKPILKSKYMQTVGSAPILMFFVPGGVLRTRDT